MLPACRTAQIGLALEFELTVVSELMLFVQQSQYGTRIEELFQMGIRHLQGLCEMVGCEWFGDQSIKNAQVDGSKEYLRE